MSIRLSALLPHMQCEVDPIINGMTCDSGQVQPGNVFCAIKGLHHDGRNFIQQAFDQGAVAAIVQADNTIKTQWQAKPIIAVEKLREQLGEIASRFYDHPSQSMRMIGVTGTNGKTSVCYFVAQLLNHLAKRSAIIGTIGWGLPDQLQLSSLTTPSAIELQRIIATLQQNHIQNIAMEVSSHALEQYRTAGIDYKIAVFTNLSHEHLDYHGTMENYFAAKQKLFLHSSLSAAVINISDPYGERLAQSFTKDKVTVSFSEQLSADYQLLTTHTSGLQTQVELNTTEGRQTFVTPIQGQFQIENLIMAVAVVVRCGMRLQDVLAAAAHCRAVPGRFECFGGEQQPLVVVDYAHTPDALARMLASVQSVYPQRAITCVFGCGGDRDTSKRHIMGAVAEQYCQQVIITNDNPRTEDPQQIINGILTGFSQLTPEVILDRRQAITAAIARASVNDVIVIAGKGHEQYQAIGSQRYPFSDPQVVQLALENAA